MLQRKLSKLELCDSLSDVHDFDDPDLVTPELIHDVLQRELNKSRADTTITSQPGNNSTAELIALGSGGGGGSGSRQQGNGYDPNPISMLLANCMLRVLNFKQNSRRSTHHSRRPNTSIVAISL